MRDRGNQPNRRRNAVGRWHYAYVSCTTRSCSSLLPRWIEASKMLSAVHQPIPVAVVSPPLLSLDTTVIFPLILKPLKYVCMLPTPQTPPSLRVEQGSRLPPRWTHPRSSEVTTTLQSQHSLTSGPTIFGNPFMSYRCQWLFRSVFPSSVVSAQRTAPSARARLYVGF